jgi:hypothetical protein
VTPAGNVTIEGIVLVSQPPSSFPDGGQAHKRDDHRFYKLAPIHLTYDCPTPAPPTPEPPGLPDAPYTCADAESSLNEYTCGDSIIGTTASAPDASAEVDGVACGLDPGLGTWHRIRTGPDTTTLTVSNCNDFTQYDTRLHLYEDCGGACLAFNDDSCGAYYAATLTAAVQPNTVYYVLQSGYQSQAGPYQIDLVCAGATPSPTPAPTPAPPDNDMCEDAIPITCNETVIASTASSTSDYNSAPLANCAGGAGNGVWYNLTMPDDGVRRTVYLSNCGEATDFDTKLHVAQATSCTDDAPVCKGYNDDAGGDCPSLRSEVAFHTDPGASYLIVQSGASSYEGTFQLDVGCETSTPAPTPHPPAEHDTCEGAVPIACGDVVVGNLNGANPYRGNCLSAEGGALWFLLETTHKAVVTISSCGPGNDLRNALTVHDECVGACVASDVYGCGGNQAEVAFLATEYVPYYLMVAGYYSYDQGSYNMTVTCEAVPTTAPTPVPTSPPTVKPTGSPTSQPTPTPPTQVPATSATNASATSTTNSTTTAALSSTGTETPPASPGDSSLSTVLGTTDSTDSGLVLGGLIAAVLVAIVCCAACLALAHRRRREARGLERTASTIYFGLDEEDESPPAGTRSRTRSRSNVRNSHRQSTKMASVPGYTTVPMADSSSDTIPSGGSLKPIAAKPERRKSTKVTKIEPLDDEDSRRSMRSSVRRSAVVKKGTLML